MPLYILSEEKSQENFRTKAKYLFTSTFNSRAVFYFDLNKKNYVYLSTTYGIIDPDKELDPYLVKSLSPESFRVWGLLTYSLISKRLEPGSEVMLLYSYNKNYKHLERLLSNYYKISSPIKYFNNELKLRWLNSLIQDSISRKLT